MNIEKIAAKLRPLLPTQVDHWMRVRDMAEPELKTLIEKQILSVAYKRLGDFNTKILLSLPPENKCKGTLNIGTVLYDKPKWPVAITQKELLQNMGIYGRSGAGKSNFCYHLIRQLDQLGIPFLFFDQKRNLRDMLFSLKSNVHVYTAGRSLLKFGFNPFMTPPGLEPSVYIGQMVDVMASAFTLGEGAKSIIQKALTACYNQGNSCPITQDILSEIEAMEAKDRIRGWKISAIRALESLRFSNIASDPVSQADMTRALIHENTVIEVDGLSNGARSFLIPILYQWIFQVKLCSPGREKLEMAVITDEAHIVFAKQQGRSQETLMERLFRMTRELGIANIILDQTPSLMSRTVLANCYTNIFLNLSSVADQTLAASVCLLDADDRRYFSMLPIGQAICKLQGRYTNAFLMEIPWIQFTKGAVNDAQLARYSALNRSRKSGSGRNTPLPGYFGQVPQVPALFNSPLNNESFRLLWDIQNQPLDGVKIRYKRLNLSIGKGNRIKQQLIEQGWLHSQTVDLGQTRKVILGLTQQARDVLDIQNPQSGYGSLLHRYWQHYTAQRLREQGYQVTVEAPRLSGNTDIATQKEGRKIALEIETGLSDFLQNIRQNLLARYDTIIIIATDKPAYEKIEKTLAAAGLLLPPKVQLVLRDAFIGALEPHHSADKWT
jgi:hypothetical protein